MSDSVSTRLRRLVIQRAHEICEYCLIHQDDACFSFHIDHIVSRKQRGATTSANLALSCLRCNVAKGTDPGTFIGRPPRLVRLYHPRQDRWVQHFRLAAARIVPLTDQGLATVRLLDLNAADRLLLRKTLIKAGRYPSIEALAYLSG
jgi:hypothetical protein